MFYVGVGLFVVIAIVSLVVILAKATSAGPSCYDEGMCPNMGTCDGCDCGYP